MVERTIHLFSTAFGCRFHCRFDRRFLCTRLLCGPAWKSLLLGLLLGLLEQFVIKRKGFCINLHQWARYFAFAFTRSRVTHRVVGKVNGSSAILSIVTRLLLLVLAVCDLIFMLNTIVNAVDQLFFFFRRVIRRQRIADIDALQLFHHS